MKKIIILLLIVAVFTSCEKWLSITPKAEISSDLLFESEQGFKDALFGVYLLMTQSKDYALESTLGFVDILAQQYNMQGSTNQYYYISLYQYNHSSFVSRRDNIWANKYNIIANLNNAINQIDDHADKMHPINYKVIKGELYGLRAYLHFDLLRLFGYGNLVNNPSRLNESTIPYVTTYSKELHPQVTVRQFIDSLKRDLNVAVENLKEYDSYTRTSQRDSLERPNTDGFYDLRQKHFNYYAARATQARLYMWTGEYDNAIEAATEIVDARGNRFSWHNGNINNADARLKDFTFSTEHIFGLDILGLFDIVNPLIRRYAADGININYQRLNHTGAYANELFEINAKPQMSESDYRYKELYNKISSTEFLLLKFTYVEGSTFRNNMPLIKLPEMYYILAEAYNKKGDQATAVSHINTVRRYRGIETVWNLSDDLTQEQVDDEIQLEYRKEMISEGQLFYYYKRLGKQSIPGTATAMDESIYVLPMPDRELEFR